jgi:hypothetical protein
VPRKKRSSRRTQAYSHGVPAKYTAGAKNKKKSAAEIKKTAAAYKAGKKIDIKAVERSRGVGKKRTTKRRRR